MLTFEKGGPNCCVRPSNPSDFAVISGDMHIGNMCFIDYKIEWYFQSTGRVFFQAGELSQILDWLQKNKGNPTP